MEELSHKENIRNYFDTVLSQELAVLYLNSGKLQPKEYLSFYEFMSESKLIQKNVETGGILNVIALLFIFKSKEADIPANLSL